MVTMWGWFSAEAALRFLDEPLAAALVGDPVVRQDLDRDLALESWVARAIHLAHAARADQRKHFVRAEFRPGGQGHCGLLRPRL